MGLITKNKKEDFLKAFNTSISFILLGSFLIWTGCAPSASSLKKVIEENPEIIFGAIEKNPKRFFDIVNKAAKVAQNSQREDEAKADEKKREEEFANPKKPEITKNRAILGKKEAPVTIVEFSDFQCPYCSRGYETVKAVVKEYGDKVRVIYKHLPLDFHPLAMPAAQYFEAINLQSSEKAYKFHDYIFENQGGLKSKGKKFLLEAAKKAGANISKMKKDLESDVVKKIIAADMAEAKKFGFSGTPGFLINGVMLKGAYPVSEFKVIIDRHLKAGGKK